MRVAVAHNAIRPGENDAATLDVLEQAEHVQNSLIQAGHEAKLFPLDRNLEVFLRRLKRFRPDNVFNLVESVEGFAELHPCAAALWELIGVPHTGSSARTLDHTVNKGLTKTILANAGIPTAEWAEWRGDGDAWRQVPGPWILKPVMEDASIGIDEDSVVRKKSLVQPKLVEMKKKFPGQPVLVERYVDGREFNISLLAQGKSVQVLPPAEMVFIDYPAGKEHVLGFRAKWDPAAFEYSHTERRFDFPANEWGLIRKMKDVARKCWELFDMRGYARADMRVDKDGGVFVLEINANPCLTPDAGFSAAVARAGISPGEMVERILEDSVCVPQQL